MELLPANVQVHKLKKPKDWSYPFKTSDIITALKLADLQKKISIFYDNVPERPYRLSKKFRPSYSFSVFSITYYGHLPKEDADSLPGPYFHMCVRVCKPEYRQQLFKNLEQFMPRVTHWMETIQNTKSINSIKLRYEDFSERIPSKLVLSENGVEVFSIKIDLKEEDG